MARSVTDRDDDILWAIYWVLVSESDFLVRRPILPHNLCFYYILGPRDLARKLDRVGAVLSCAVIARIVRRSVSRNDFEI